VRTPIVVVGASAGGVEVLSRLVRALPPDLDAAVLVVLHLPETSSSRLAHILDVAGPLPAATADDGEDLRPGRVLVAPPGCHLLVHGERVRLTRGAKENGHRPAVDALFRSVARWVGPGVAAVVLSGVLDDGAAGAAAVALQGGVVLVQDPEDALFDGMPRAALSAVPGASVRSVEEIARALSGLLSARAAGAAPPVSDDLVLETDMAQTDENATSGVEAPGEPANVSCPECHGAMSRVTTGRATHFRCHVGHAYGPASLVHAQTRATEAALWSAVATLEEQVSVLRDLAERGQGSPEDLARADEAARQAAALRRQLRTGVGISAARSDADR
jgi:two-component system chemotaxis response regulator CheB